MPETPTAEPPKPANPWRRVKIVLEGLAGLVILKQFAGLLKRLRSGDR